MWKFSIKKSLSLAMTEFVKWAADARMIIFGVLLIFIYSLVIEPLMENAVLMGEPLNILEPFIAVENSGLVLLIIPLVFLTLIADFPKIDTNTAFYISRTGRVNWLAGQIIKLVLMGISCMTVIFLGSVLPVIAKGSWGNVWSRTATDFAENFPERSGSFGAQLIPKNLYNQMSVFTAAVESSLLVYAYLMVIGLLLLFFSLIKRKTMGFVLCGFIISMGTALCSVKTKLMWSMPMANSIIWLHYTEYFSEPVMPLWFSVCYLCTAVLVLMVLCFYAIRKFNYDKLT